MNRSDLIKQAAATLHAGGLVAFPTETVYGLGADATNPEAVKRIFSAKGRPSDHPLIVHIGEIGELTKWAKDIPDSAWELAKKFWPGPLTMILRRNDTVCDSVTGMLDTVALRIPEHPLALELLREFGGGIAAPSANRYGRVSPTSAEDVYEELGDRVDVILDGGRCSVGIESTIVDLSAAVPRLLRPGSITKEAMSHVLGFSFEAAEGTDIRYPGGDPSHYSPMARVVLATWENAEEKLKECLGNGERVGLLASHLPNNFPPDAVWLRIKCALEEQAYELYHSLRQADHIGLQVLVVVMPENSGIGQALCDRLYRAAGLGFSNTINALERH